MFFIIKTQTAKQAIKEIKTIQDEFKDEVVKIEVIIDRGLHNCVLPED